MENKNFKFEDIGKQTPYRIPDNYFDGMQQKVLKRINEEDQKKHRTRLIIIYTLAALIAGLIFIPTLNHRFGSSSDNKTTATNTVVMKAQTNDGWIQDLSDEELETMTTQTNNDEFLQ
jgi:hypothetical protein